jgi:hypothetical protein
MRNLGLMDPAFLGGLEGGILWTSAQISTALWLDAADSSTITTVDGEVIQWNDKSGNSRNVSQTTANNRPTLTTENSLVALSFDGINDFLSNTSVGLPTGSSARSMFVVYRPLRIDNSNNICGQGLSEAPGSWYMLQHRSLGAFGDPYFAGYNADLTDFTVPTTTRKMAGITYNGTQATLYRNATQIAQSNLTLNTTGNNFYVGVNPQANSEFACSTICEIVFTANLTTTNTRQQLEGYLAHKWGLTANLPNDHPFKVSPPYVPYV